MTTKHTQYHSNPGTRTCRGFIHFPTGNQNQEAYNGASWFFTQLEYRLLSNNTTTKECVMSKKAFLRVKHGHNHARIIHSGGKKSRALHSKHQARQEVIKLHEKEKVTSTHAHKLLREIRKSPLPEQTPSEIFRAHRSSDQRIEQVLVFQ